jgi:hypothetical protein
MNLSSRFRAEERENAVGSQRPILSQRISQFPLFPTGFFPTSNIGEAQVR